METVDSWEGRAPMGRYGASPRDIRQGPKLPTFPLLTFSAQALTYIGMAITTSSQACTVPAFQWDMGVVLTSSTCCSRSICSSPSDRLRLCRVGLHWLSESATHRTQNLAVAAGGGGEGEPHTG